MKKIIKNRRVQICLVIGIIFGISFAGCLASISGVFGERAVSIGIVGLFCDIIALFLLHCIFGAKKIALKADTEE